MGKEIKGEQSDPFHHARIGAESDRLLTACYGAPLVALNEWLRADL